MADSMVTVHFRKGDHLLKVGQRVMKMYFVPEGCIREYVITDGEDITMNFYTEGQWAMSLNSFSPQGEATHNWVYMEDTAVVKGDEEQAHLYRGEVA